MKHIKKKYLFQIKADKDVQIPGSSKAALTDKNLIKKSKGHAALVFTKNGYMVKSLPLNYKGKNAIIPIPDLSLLRYGI